MKYPGRDNLSVENKKSCSRAVRGHFGYAAFIALQLNTFIPLQLYTFTPLHLYSFTALQLYTFTPLQLNSLKKIWMKNKIIYLCIPILSAFIKKHCNEKNISAIQQKEA
jgi:hypothetical protein